MKLDRTLLDNLTAQAKASPWLRMNLDLRDSADDGSQRMQNALEPGTIILECKDGAYEPLGEEDCIDIKHN